VTVAEPRDLEQVRQRADRLGRHHQSAQRAVDVLERRLGRPARHAAPRERAFHPRVGADDRAPRVGLTLDVVDRIVDRADDLLGERWVLAGGRRR
jgi:hypothetical protein